MSGENNITIMVRSFQNGAFFFLTKPLKMDLLRTLWQFVMVQKEGKFRGKGDDISKILTSSRLIDQSSRKRKHAMIIDGEYSEEENNDVGMEINPINIIEHESKFYFLIN